MSLNMKLDFGTSGIRGIIGNGPTDMNVNNISLLSQAVSDYLNYIKCNGSVAIAYDSRINSALFAKTTASVFASNGIKVYIYKELMPVPCLSYIVRHLGLDMGVMITASHNPSKYNGYKVYGSNGCQISKDAANSVVKNMESIDIDKDIKSMDFEEGIRLGLIEYISNDNIEDYLNDTLKLSVLGNNTKKNARIVYSPLNGTGRYCVSEILHRDGFNDVWLVKEQEYPDGNFPTCPKPNPELHETLSLGINLAKVKNADIVICTDPDCDRVGIAIKKDNEYKCINGNEIGILLFDYICSCHIKNNTMSSNPTLVKTVVTSDMFYELARFYNIEVRDSLVGFKPICDQVEKLLSENRNFIFGLEESYGYLSRTDVRDKDAVNASLLIAEMTSYYKDLNINLIDRLEEIYDKFGYFESSLLPFEFEGDNGKSIIDQVMIDVRNFKLGKDIFDFKLDNDIGKANMVKVNYGNGNSILVRPSGTEPKIKFYIQVRGNNRENAIKLLKEYEQRVNEYISLFKQLIYLY